MYKKIVKKLWGPGSKVEVSVNGYHPPFGVKDQPGKVKAAVNVCQER